MDVVEYLLFIPLLIYGIALSDLFSQWKRFMEPNSWHLPYLLTLLMVTEIGVYNVFIFFKLSSRLSNIGYFTYWLYLVPPLVFMLMVNFLNFKEDSLDLPKAFSDNIRPVYLLLAIFFSLHLIPQFQFSSEYWPPRVIGSAVCVLYAFKQTKPFYYLVLAAWLYSLVVKVMLP